jgi:hypothetical protein
MEGIDMIAVNCTQCSKGFYIKNAERDYFKPYICPDCEEKNAQEKKAKYLAELEQLTITERLRLIEERLYDMAHAKKHQEFNPWTPIC